MARSRKAIRPRRVYIPAAATRTLWLENDGYDRRAWSEIVAGATTIGDLTEAGERMVPHFGAFLEDLFLALFKYNLVWNKPDEVRRSAILNRTLLQALIPSPIFAALKERTLLEEDKAAIAALVLAEQVLETLRAEKLLNRNEMLDLWDLKHREDDLDQKIESLKSAVELTEQPVEKPQEQSEEKPGEEGEPSEESAQNQKANKAEEKRLRRNMDEFRETAERAAQVAEARLNQKAREIERQIGNADRGELRKLELKSGQLTTEIDRIAEDSRDFSREFGQGGRVSAGDRLELGKRLARNRKIGELARMVGRFKQEARALKKRTLEHGAIEAYDIERGAEIGRLIPAELLALHHPGLAMDFRRRLIEGDVLQYRLRDDDQRGKGPMVVCIDVSSSMQGDKELWAKAVSLTLMDIARRQRRLFRAILFSSGDQTLKVLDLNRERRYQPELTKVLEMAEYFPGGGTDFERPLTTALELIEHRGLKRADIVMITDGEASLSAEFIANLRERKEALQFSVFSVLVDIASSQASTLAAFSDRVTSVRKLTGPEGARDIFLKLQS
jgi:uncharacterized protein with von Willebrand factor type A (vWA) domain